MKHSINIQMLSPNASNNLEKMEHITNIINRVYTIAEEGLYHEGSERTTVDEVVKLTKNNEFAVARLGEKIVGCIRIRRADQHTGEFGMLAVDKKYQENGIGQKLINFAEEKCHKENVHKMQLELLVPVVGSHQGKKILKKWYVQNGYHPVHTEKIEDSYPEFIERLAIPCEFIVFQKDLSLQAKPN